MRSGALAPFMNVDNHLSLIALGAIGILWIDVIAKPAPDRARKAIAFSSRWHVHLSIVYNQDRIDVHDALLASPPKLETILDEQIYHLCELAG